MVEEQVTIFSVFLILHIGGILKIFEQRFLDDSDREISYLLIV